MEIKYLLTSLKNMIVSRVLYALPAFYGFILQSDVDRINAMFRKAKRWGIVTDELDLDGPPIYFGWLTYFTKSNMRITDSTTCFLKSTRLCLIAYVADQPDMSHLEQIFVNC